MLLFKIRLLAGLLLGLAGCTNQAVENEKKLLKHQSEKEVVKAKSMLVEHNRRPEVSQDSRPVKLPQTYIGKSFASEVAQKDIVDAHQVVDNAGKLGVHIFKSKRIKLWTDLRETDVSQLLPCCEQLLSELDKYFAKSPLQKVNQGRIFTGYLIHDREKFKALDFLPKGIITSEHGTYFQDKFWVTDQPTEYYWRHLVFHELVHAYMNVLPNNWPEAYQEGMAEFFATHHFTTEKLVAEEINFQVFPRNFVEYAGLTRLQTIQQEIKLQKPLSLLQIVDLKDQSFPNNLTAYSWSWGWAYFLANHPLTKHEFIELATPQSRENFREKFLAICGDLLEHLELEWKILTHQMSAGSHYPNSFIELPFGELKNVGENELVHEIRASKCWQPTGWQVTAGLEYEITAEGEVILDTVPADWVSQPNGVGLRYSLNQPLGVLQLAIYTKVDEKFELDSSDFLQPVKVGKGLVYKAPKDGQLYFRVNDFWTEIWNNKGSYRVKIKNQ